MTLVTLMDAVKEEVEAAVADDPALQDLKGGPITVYAGFPETRTSAKRMPSFVYCMVTKWSDTDNPELYSSAQVELGFSIEDPEFMTLMNFMEHVRQRLLAKRILAERYSLQLPLKGEIPTQQPVDSWQGRIQVTYSIGQPEYFGAEYVYE
ncbi:hypothetical protein FX155_07120 [Acidaminococcus fermentans]|uniref:Tail terminator n=1 Tax=Acidaminococcus fermentans TaxID=905 RepID=A0A6N7W1P2_ACIFE|nr:hypothetical protein [Acidaminococcus fermentans]MSS82362.1 hypothetical protein [Acidaminococcus fermentans]